MARLPSKLLLLLLTSVPVTLARAADPIIITGPEQKQINLKLPYAGLLPYPGVANIQIFRASHAAPEQTDGRGWTYNHHVDMACWKKRLYVAWNSCEKDEDIWPSHELYATSEDGLNWSKPAELFPQGASTAARMYFYLAKNGRMLTIAGLRTSNDTLSEYKKGALVVREIRADHSLGEFYMLRAPSDPHPRLPPIFSSAKDPGFVDACDQLLHNKPFLEQQDYGNLLGDARMKWHDINTWPADEPSRPYFPKRFGKAMCFYHRKDGALVAVMKWGWVLLSRDEGQTWTSPVRPPTLVAGMAKVWGQRTADDRYALLYNPDLAERYPLAIVTGDDGITFANMRIIHGELPPIRYPGLYKAIGPQYVRGISEWSTDNSFPDCSRATWVSYSMSKEDIWVSRIPLTTRSPATASAPFSDDWNLYCPAWAPITAEIEPDGTPSLHIKDQDPSDYARATRMFPASRHVQISVEYQVNATTSKPLQFELRGDNGASILCFSSPSEPLNRWTKLDLAADTSQKSIAVSINGSHLRDVPIPNSIERFHAISFRTGERQSSAAEPDRPGAPSTYRLKNLVVR